DDGVGAGLIGGVVALPPGVEPLVELVDVLSDPIAQFGDEVEVLICLSHGRRREQGRQAEAEDEYPDRKSRLGSSSHVVLAFSSGPAQGLSVSVWTPPPLADIDARQLSSLGKRAGADLPDATSLGPQRRYWRRGSSGLVGRGRPLDPRRHPDGAVRRRVHGGHSGRRRRGSGGLPPARPGRGRARR